MLCYMHSLQIDFVNISRTALCLYVCSTHLISASLSIYLASCHLSDEAIIESPDAWIGSISAEVFNKQNTRGKIY